MVAVDIAFNYLARAVSSLKPDLGKAVVSGFVRACTKKLLDRF